MKNFKMLLSIKANANENKIVGWMEETLKIKIKATPVNGKANEELIKFLADSLSLEKQHIQITSGHTSSRKVVAFIGIDKEELYRRIQQNQTK